MKRSLSIVASIALLQLLAPAISRASPMISDEGLRELDMQRLWAISLPLDPGETVIRAKVLDDNLYVFSSLNRVFAIHVATGVHRWSNEIGKIGQIIRGPAHNDRFAFFTTPGSVRIIDRRTGEPAEEIRNLRGVIIEVKHDIAEINMGELHGLKGGEILSVQTVTESGESAGAPLATLEVTTVRQRTAKGRLTRLNTSVFPEAGHRVSADLAVPLREVVLPFAASSAACADDKFVYVGAANQKFYCLDFIRGVQEWSILTPRTVVAQPVIVGPDLYIGGQDGLIISCTRKEKVKNWTFQTEGPIFADLRVTPDRVYAASSDRSLYCLDRKTGKKLWRERYDTGLRNAPVYSDNRVYQIVPDGGLFVLNAETGESLWKRPAGGHFLIQEMQDVYLAEANTPTILRVDARDGKIKQTVDAGPAVALAAAREGDFQAIFLTDRNGAVTCIRSRFAPRLRPDDLLAVLRDDRKIRISEELDRQKQLARVEPQKPEARRMTSRDFLFEQDWLTSTSSIRPLGGHGAAIESAGKPADDSEAAGSEETADTASEETEDEDSMDAGEDESDAESEDEEESDEEEEDEEDAEEEEEEDEEAKPKPEPRKPEPRTGG